MWLGPQPPQDRLNSIKMFCDVGITNWGIKRWQQCTINSLLCIKCRATGDWNCDFSFQSSNDSPDQNPGGMSDIQHYYNPSMSQDPWSNMTPVQAPWSDDVAGSVVQHDARQNPVIWRYARVPRATLTHSSMVFYIFFHTQKVFNFSNYLPPSVLHPFLNNVMSRARLLPVRCNLGTLQMIIFYTIIPKRQAFLVISIIINQTFLTPIVFVLVCGTTSCPSVADLKWEHPSMSHTGVGCNKPIGWLPSPNDALAPIWQWTASNDALAPIWQWTAPNDALAPIWQWTASNDALAPIWQWTASNDALAPIGQWTASNDALAPYNNGPSY